MSESVSFVMSLAVLAMFAAMFFPVGADTFKQSTEKGAIQQMEYEGQRIASSLENVDRLVRQSKSSGPIGEKMDVSSEAAGRSYYINVTYSSSSETGVVRLYTTNDDLHVEVTFHSETPVKEGVYESGAVRVVRERGSNRITVMEVDR